MSEHTVEESIYIVDSHCHLNSYDDLDLVIERAKGNNVTKMVTIGTQIDDFQQLYSICEKHKDCCFMTVGVHPDYALGLDEAAFDFAYRNAFSNVSDRNTDYSPVIGVGEIGLDYRDSPDSFVKNAQKKVFEYQLHLAGEYNKPVYIHTRDAIVDTLETVAAFPNVCGIFHCFCEGVDIARKVLDLGYVISLSGIVTFKNAPVVHDVARYVPLDRLLVETDAPYLAPVPYRGKRNEPAYTRFVAEHIAVLRNVEPEVVFAQTTANFYNLFGIL
ncbi:MAG: TatD family hydrolase [Holosporales bacterium]|nr:TatD family hydrolase [Holosporales bacterium]